MASWGKGGRKREENDTFSIFFLGTAVFLLCHGVLFFGFWFSVCSSKFPKRIISPFDLLGEEAHCDGERDDVDGQEAEDGQDVPKVPPLRENNNRVRFFVFQGTNEQGLMPCHIANLQSQNSILFLHSN